MLSHHNQSGHHARGQSDLHQKQMLQGRQNELFQAQKKLDIYRSECEVLGDRIQTQAPSLNQHIEHYASWLAKRNLMVKAAGRNTPESKALIARAEAACLRLETLVESLRTGSQEAQRRIFRVFKSQINRAVSRAVTVQTETLLAEYDGDLSAFQAAHSSVAAQGSGWHERVTKAANPWLQPENVLDQFNLNILQLERQVNLHRQGAIQAAKATTTASGLTYRGTFLHQKTQGSGQAVSSQSPLLAGQSTVHGFTHYAWMPSFYRSGTHYQVIAENDRDKSTFLLNFLGWIEYNIPRANIDISQLTDNAEAWKGHDVAHFGVEGMMRHWSSFQNLMETRLRSQHQQPQGSQELTLPSAENRVSESGKEETGLPETTIAPTSYREHYALFDEYEQLLPFIPRSASSEFRSVLVAGNIPKMHLIFVSQSPSCGSLELTSEYMHQVAQILIGEKLIESVLAHRGHELFGSQFNAIKEQFLLWKERTKNLPDKQDLSFSYSAFGLIKLEEIWQFVLLPPPGYFIRKTAAQENSTKLQSPDETDIQWLESNFPLEPSSD